MPNADEGPKECPFLILHKAVEGEVILLIGGVEQQAHILVKWRQLCDGIEGEGKAVAKAVILNDDVVPLLGF